MIKRKLVHVANKNFNGGRKGEGKNAGSSQQVWIIPRSYMGSSLKLNVSIHANLQKYNLFYE